MGAADMSFGDVFFAAACWCCALPFAGIAVWAFRRRTPMPFWTGVAVRPDEIADIPAYNRANGVMWAVYAACMAASGLAALVSLWAGVAALVVVCVPGAGVLIALYGHIYRKYHRV